jgi:hypothetical protein
MNTTVNTIELTTTEYNIAPASTAGHYVSNVSVQVIPTEIKSYLVTPGAKDVEMRSKNHYTMPLRNDKSAFIFTQVVHTLDNTFRAVID